MASIPSPPVALNGHCSVIYNINGADTLFTYQANAFQYLPLKQGGQWAPLPQGVAVNGAKCVLGQWDHKDALIVVGGTTTDPKQKDFPGLQYYTFATKTWASIPSGTTVTQNRQMHNAVFLKSSNSLLVYSGFQDNSFKQSSETFTITAEPPYNVQSHPAAAPLGMNPILLPWNASHAVMTGGSAENRAVWLFSMEREWQQTGASIPASVSNMSAVQAATIQGTNDAKALQLFDLNVVPNTVTSLLVQQSSSSPVGGNVHARDIDLGNWPVYNGTLADSKARSSYSLTQSPNSDLVVASGGSSVPVAVFNQTANNWVNQQVLFSGVIKPNSNLQSPLGSSTSSSASSSSTAISSAVTSSAAATTTDSSATSTTSSAFTSVPTVTTGGDGLSEHGRTILGAVLGAIAGLGALLIILLLCIRWRKSKQRQAALAGAGASYPRENKRQMGFDDSAVVVGYNKRSPSKSSLHSAQDGFRTPTAQEKLGATISKPSLISDSSSPSRDVAPRHLVPPIISSTLPPTETKGDDGWNQYFSKSTSNSNLLPQPFEGRMRVDSVSRQTEYTLSSYDVESHTASIYHDRDTDPLNPRSSGYPQSEESWEQSRLHPKHTRQASSVYRPGSAISEEVPDSFLHAPSSSSGTQAWDALGAGNGQRSFNRRPSSSIYAESVTYPHPGDRVNFPGDQEDANTTRAEKTNSTNNSWRTATDPRGMRTLVTKDLISPTPAAQGRQKDDMSWLNLGR